jgi:nucleoside-diphosphate-sugar epimerase
MNLDMIEENLSQKKVLVTGATGFIGSHLVERLVSLNAQVTAMGPSLGWRSTVKNLVQKRRVRFVKLRAFWSPAVIERVRSAIQGTDYVIHLAYVVPGGKSPLEKAVDDIRRNVLGTMQFMQSLPASVLKICFASSTMVYGSNPPLPVSETDCVHPMCIYSSGKFAAENYLQIHAKENGISTVILRYATVYGSMETVPRAIPNFIRCVMAGKPPVIYGKGDDMCDYVHVNDVVEATLLALAKDIGSLQVINVGSGKGYTTRDIAERILKLTGKRIKPTHIQANHVTKRIVCDITHASNILGYKPDVELDHGLMDEIKFFSDNPKFWRGK